MGLGARPSTDSSCKDQGIHGQRRNDLRLPGACPEIGLLAVSVNLYLPLPHLFREKKKSLAISLGHASLTEKLKPSLHRNQYELRYWIQWV